MNQKPGRSALSPFLRIIRHHWPAMALGAFLSLLASLAGIGLLSLSGWFIAATAYAGLNATTAKAFNFFLPSIGVRLFAMIRTGARYAERIISHDATFRILESLRKWSFQRIEPLSPAGLTRHHSGDLLTRIITDIDTLDNLYLRVMTPTLVAAIAAAMLVGFIGYWHPIMGLYNASLLVVAGVMIPIMAERSGRTAARQLNINTARLRTTMVEGIHGLAAMVAFGAQDRYMASTLRRHLELVRSQHRMSQLTGVFNALIVLVSGLVVTGTLYIGVHAVSNGILTGPHLVLLVLAAIAGFEVAVPLTTAYQYFGQIDKAANRLREVTDAQPVVIFPKNSVQEPHSSLIEFDKVSFQYARKGQPVLENISFKMTPGQHTAIMGATGSGKSTLIYLLSRFEDPTCGQIRLGHYSLNTLSEKSLRNQICIVDQQSHIFNGTVRDNLRLTDPSADDNSLRKALSAVLLDKFIGDLPNGLETWVGDAGRLLSGGQAHRLAIARAMLSKAPIWAFDEPTEGLDPATAKSMMNNLLASAKGRSIIMITHRPEAIAKMDQVILLEGGQIAAIGTPSRLNKQSTLYRRLMKSMPKSGRSIPPP